jgi:hypothetical protein
LSVSSGDTRKETAMMCTRAFEGQAGKKFGLRVLTIDNATFCTVEVMAGTAGGAHPVGRYGLDELRDGKAVWTLEAKTTYVIAMQVGSKVAGKDVSVQVEIPMGSGSTSDCSRMSGGLVGNWRVDVL